MVLNRAGLPAVGADHQVRRHHRFNIGRNKFCNALYAPAGHTVGIEVIQEGIEALVATEYEAMGVWCCLEHPAQLKGYVEVQSVFART